MRTRRAQGGGSLGRPWWCEPSLSRQFRAREGENMEILTAPRLLEILREYWDGDVDGVAE